MTLDHAALRDAYRAARPRYKQLAEHVAGVLEAAIRERGLKVLVEHRPKDVPNFVRKALKKYAEDPEKHADPMATISDKAGVRVIVPHLEARDIVRDVIGGIFDVDEFDDTLDRYEPHELGYLGWHFLVRLSDPIEEDALDIRGLVCEIQVQTKAQNAWSDLSHPLLYKPPGRPPPARIARRLNLAVALVELFDQEVDGARHDIITAEGYAATAMYQVLERQFLQLSYDDFDGELTLQILEGVQHAYEPDELARFDEVMSAFVTGRREVIEQLYERYRNDEEAHPLLFQPEALAIYERLTTKPRKLKAIWRDHVDLPLAILDQLGVVFGAG